MPKKINNMLRNKISTTLMEILVVLIIIGVIAALAFPGFQRTRNNALSREAISNLRLIAAAQKAHRMKCPQERYLPCDDTAACNAGLRLDLNPNNWGYSVVVAGAPEVATLSAIWNDDANCIYTLTSANFYANPGSTGCPEGMQ